MDPAYPGVDVIFSDIAFYLWLHIVGTVVNTGFREATEPDLRRKDEALGWMADIDPGRRLQCRINIIPRARISLEDFVQITTVPPRRLSRAVSKEKI